MPTIEEEKRRSRRFELSLPAKVVRVGQAPAQQRVETANISSTGVLLNYEADLHTGTNIEVEVDLPKEITNAGPIRIRCMGRVVRVSRGTRTNVAVAIQRYEFMRVTRLQPEVM